MNCLILVPDCAKTKLVSFNKRTVSFNNISLFYRFGRRRYYVLNCGLKIDY